MKATPAHSTMRRAAFTFIFSGTMRRGFVLQRRRVHGSFVTTSLCFLRALLTMYIRTHLHTHTLPVSMATVTPERLFDGDAFSGVRFRATNSETNAFLPVLHASQHVPRT